MSASVLVAETKEPSVKDLLIVQLLNQRETAERWVVTYQKNVTEFKGHLARNEAKLAEVKALLALIDPDMG